MDYREIIFICFLITGCTVVKDCELDENRKLALVEFYNYSDRTRIDTLIFNQVTSEDSPYLFYSEDDVILGAMYFPLNPEVNSSRFFLETDSMVYDLNFVYEREFSVYDVDCDPSIRFFNLNCTSLVFDSLVVVNPVLNREELTNVKVYF